MDLAETKRKLEETEALLTSQPIAYFASLDTPYGKLHVSITDRLRRKCRKGRVWKSNAMLTALKNAGYGFDIKTGRRRSGVDGIFCIDRNYRPANSMMKKLFDQFMDKPDPLLAALSNTLQAPVEDWVPVRLVSHHMRLLGVIAIVDGATHLTLVDYDNE